jgi:hypothetical protein
MGHRADVGHFSLIKGQFVLRNNRAFRFVEKRLSEADFFSARKFLSLRPLTLNKRCVVGDVTAMVNGPSSVNRLSSRCMMITTNTVFKIVLLVCIALLVGLVVKLEMASGGGISNLTMHALATDTRDNL